MQMQQTYAYLPGEGPKIFLREVQSLLELILDELLNIATLGQLYHDVDTFPFPGWSR